MNSPTTLIRNVVIDGGARGHALIRGGRLVGLCDATADADLVIDGKQGRLIPGLVDHHIHLLAAAAASTSFDFSQTPGANAATFEETITALAAVGPVRAIGYSDDSRPILNRWELDELSGAVPVRIQYRTGGLWVLNSAALDSILVPGSPVPAAFERDERNRLTGRVWRGDAYLGRSAATAPTLEKLGKDLARWGVTGVTDASVTTDQRQATVIAQAAQRLPQRLCLMSGGKSPLNVADARFSVGPVKIMLDEHDLPSFDEVIRTIHFARSQGRRVAAHCVTPTELAFMIAAWKTAGTQAGDRIEHGSLIPHDLIPVLQEYGVTIVTQPGFVFSRGDRYLTTVPIDQHADLYRLNSLVQAAIPVAAGSDAPYGPVNPWIAIRAAVDRRTQRGLMLGESERIDLDTAMTLYGGTAENPGEARGIHLGMVADLCLLRGDLSWPDQDPVALTLIGGEVVYSRDSIANSDSDDDTARSDNDGTTNSDNDGTPKSGTLDAPNRAAALHCG